MTNATGMLLSAAAPLVVHGEALEGQPWPIALRLVDDLGDPLVPGAAAGNVSALSLRVFDEQASNPDSPVYERELSPVPGTVMFAALQANKRWGIDAAGYNVLDPLDPALWGGSVGGHRYRLEYEATIVAGAATASGTREATVFVQVRGTAR